MTQKHKNSVLGRPTSPAAERKGRGSSVPPRRAPATPTPRQQRIEDLRQKRDFYNWLGKRAKVARIDAELVPLVNAELRQGDLNEQVRKDLMWIAGQEDAA